MNRSVLTLLAVAGCFLSFRQSQGAESGPPPGLVVIAPESFHAALAPFMAHKNRALPSRLVSLEWILKTSPGVDDPEKVKRFLHTTWREKNLRYALLVGDADVFPVRYMVLDRVTPAAFDYAFYPSDLYYADLAKRDGQFEDWNGQTNGFHGRYFGEVRGEKNKTDPINFDQIDYRPEIAVGRWPVSTPEEVRLVVRKTITYETNAAAGTSPGLRRAAFFGVGGWVDTRSLLDRLSAGLPAGWEAERRYYADARRPATTPPPNEKELLQLLNEGVGLVAHTGHGQDDCWEQCFHMKNLGSINNADRLPVMISAGCSTARFATLPPYEPYLDEEGREHAGTNFKQIFDAPPPPPAPYQRGRFNPPGLGEQLLRGGTNGAVAYIGCNTGSQPCGLTLLEGFFRALEKSPAPRLGDCWNEAIDFYYNTQKLDELVPTESWYPPSIFFQGMKFMVFGDPSLQLPLPLAAAN